LRIIFNNTLIDCYKQSKLFYLGLYLQQINCAIVKGGNVITEDESTKEIAGESIFKKRKFAALILYVAIKI